MYKTLAKKATQKFINLEIISIDDFDIYRYGFELIFSFVSIVTAIIFFSIIISRTFETICFLIGFFVVRAICGGYHGKNHFSCFVLSITTYIIFLILYRYLFEMHHALHSISIGVIVSVIVLIAFAPAENNNNPMTRYRKKRNKTLTVFFSIILFFLLAIVFITNKISGQITSFFLGVIIATFALLVAKIQNLRKE